MGEAAKGEWTAKQSNDNNNGSPLATPVTALKGVGAKLAECLAKIDLRTVEDLLFHLPFRYEDRTRIYPIKDLSPGMTVTIEGTIIKTRVSFGRKRSLVVVLADGPFQLQCRFFHFSAAQKARLLPGLSMRCFGEVGGSAGHLSMVHPEYTLIDDNALVVPMDERLTPVYPVTDGVKQKGMRALCQQALVFLAQQPPAELLPVDWLKDYAGWSIMTALQFLHAPTPDISMAELESGEHPAMQRLIIEELVAHQLSIQALRHESRNKTALALPDQAQWQQRFLGQLPFTPTIAQQRVVAEINQDLSFQQPMQRLVQGDVGSGKTLVAAMAALRAIENNTQVALMVPTEILAEQHYQWFSEHLQAFDIRCALLVSKMPAKAKRDMLENIQLGLYAIVIGTHALFQDQVKFKRLSLVIIDEQHRFGVHQRMNLKKKGEDEQLEPHLLIMTATPIPRTLSMTAFANLDKSIIDELPPGRKPIKTAVLPDARRSEVIDKVQTAVMARRQVYWVCTLIDESELIQSQAAEKTKAELKEKLPTCRIGLVHGRLKADDKQRVMDAFKDNELDILVATTVIEVGVNVPNASLMIIENPERLGLAQLHQLRGRVGRGEQESHCILMYHGPLSKNGKARLTAMRETNDGFLIAERDLKIRGPGEILGTKQTGLVRYRIADLFRDQKQLAFARVCSERILKEQPQVAAPLVQRWLGNKVQYGNT